MERTDDIRTDSEETDPFVRLKYITAEAVIKRDVLLNIMDADTTVTNRGHIKRY